MISSITLTGPAREKQQARERLAITAVQNPRLVTCLPLIEMMANTTLSTIDRRVKHGHNLSFEEAFVGMCYALMATNTSFWCSYNYLAQQAYGRPVCEERALVCGTAFLQLMAAKEAFASLSADEVAGIAAATLLNTVVNPILGTVIETCGMGGDVGFSTNGGGRSKTINCSTMSAVVLHSLGLPVIKHGSYGNTSVMGSTDSAEELGLQTTFESETKLMEYWTKNRFLYLDAHLVKTVHDLSHLLMMETINHLAGPMSCPLSPDSILNKVMGVNEKVHPAVVAAAYAQLHRRGIQTMGTYAIVCGLDQSGPKTSPNDYGLVRQHAVLDELSPYGSVVSFGQQDVLHGTWLITPSHFGVEITPSSIFVENNKVAINNANWAALSGENSDLASYLALNAALGLFIFESTHGDFNSDGPNQKVLGDCYWRCFEAISSGQTLRTLEQLRCRN